MRVVFLGTPEFGVPSLKALVNAGYEVAGVFTQPDKPKGRGNKMQKSPVKLCAEAYGIPVFQPVKILPDFSGNWLGIRTSRDMEGTMEIGAGISETGSGSESRKVSVTVSRLSQTA